MSRQDYYAGNRWQHGHGLLGNLVRRAVPFIKSLGKRALKGLLKTSGRAALGVATKIHEGQSFKDAAKKQLQETADELIAPPPHKKKRVVRRLIKPRATVKPKGRRQKDIFDS